MAETEKLIVICGHVWREIPNNSTHCLTEVYEKQRVVAADGDVARLRGHVIHGGEG